MCVYQQLFGDSLRSPCHLPADDKYYNATRMLSSLNLMRLSQGLGPWRVAGLPCNPVGWPACNPKDLLPKPGLARMSPEQRSLNAYVALWLDLLIELDLNPTDQTLQIPTSPSDSGTVHYPGRLHSPAYFRYIKLAIQNSQPRWADGFSVPMFVKQF